MNAPITITRCASEGLLEDLAHQRDNLVGQAEQVRNAITSVHLDLSHDISSISDLVAEKVNESATRITRTLAEKGEHITLALGRAGDSMIEALGERGGDLLERLEQTSRETTDAIGTASDRLTAASTSRPITSTTNSRNSPPIWSR